ncbi:MULTISPECIES: flavodoxin family protein [unclassified Curtobacterium]|uniref:flavodoxin family protein n=1 Tax=unclassified Curtobacterium TaxID=257496 RepID=UPI003A7F88F2
MNVRVMYGTESGNAEMVADEIVDALAGHGLEATSQDLSDVDVASLNPATVILVSSTYNEGDLPASAEPFVAALDLLQPDLSGVRFAAFGLGDSTYEFYNNGIDTLRKLLTHLGAEQVGDTGKHDASSGASPIEPAVAWTSAVISNLTLTTTS